MPDLQTELTEVVTIASKMKSWVMNGHLRTIAYVILAITLVFGWNKIRDLEKAQADAQARIGTMNTQFEKLGEGYSGQGEIIKNSNAALSQAVALQGRDLTNALTQQGNQVRAMFDSQGRVIAELVKGQTTSGVIPTATGGFVGADLIQARTNGKPPLADVSLTYDPTNPNPQSRLTGSWQNYTEVFKPSVVGWQKKSDKSLTGTFRLTREVYRPDNTLVGKEEIALDNATASFDSALFSAPEPRRWSVMLGPVFNYKDHTWTPGGGLDYRVTQNISVMSGVTKDNFFIWGKYSFK